MKSFMGAAALALALVGAPAYATTTFAQFKQVSGVDTISFSGATLSNVGGSIVLFDFLDAMPPAVDGEIQAYMNFTATGTPYDGALSFLRVSDNANLLTVTFTDAVLTGGGTSGVFFDAQPGVGTITYTSDFIDFSTSTAEDFALSFSGLTHPLGSETWTADGTGTFANDNRERPGGSVPEPATWAMMIVGFGAAGAVLRRRRILAAI